MTKVTLATVKEMLDAAENKAKEIGVPMVITIVDDGGNLLASHRMDDALLASIDISLNKAWTSVALKMPTNQLTSLGKPGGELFGIHTTNDSRIVLFGGGIPLTIEETIVGAAGVSGGSVENDIEVAEAAVEAFKVIHSQ
ncbi:GlcG/HbpS family heme-binding protein [Bacillus sp. FJAT-44742]|uniref:GlcG/HbpS family heme-binding protein n=1 Tax=Bacillus sp. FJAT-44742 TaxID=2014005 RepID=UPI000C2416B5|nr:heme-binding protein [Bacillus sp. FJAT-44742]